MREELSALAGPPKAPALQWEPPGIREFLWKVVVLAFDQSLSNCGWIAFSIHNGKIVVYNKGTLRPRTGERGFMGTWGKASQLRQDLAMIISWYPGADHIVYENPAVHGHRLESSLLAGQILYELSLDKGQNIDAQHACKVLCGRPLRSDDRKQAIRAAVARYVPDSATRHWNEHQRDALALGLTHLYDLRQAA